MDAALVVLDGWGIGSGFRDAVGGARTPTMDRLTQRFRSTTLRTDGHSVGLPEGQMGNSEVGHLTIGAGRVILQSSTRINRAIDDGSLADNGAIQDAIEFAREHDGRVHLCGLLSDGGVHSAQRHLHALLELLADEGVDAVTHAFTDGRDTAPTGGVEYLADLSAVIDRVGTGAIATVSGRYYAMDRDENFERTRRAYDAIVNRDAERVAPDAITALERSYEEDVTDEYVVPTLIEGAPALSDGDAVLWFNFRADRARQLVRMLADIRPEWSFDTDPPATEIVTMTEYDSTFDLPVVFPPNEPTETLGEVVADAGKTQYRLAESEKYAHVTYFLNGGREVEFDGEQRTIVKSPDVPTYDEQPEMNAHSLTDEAIAAIETEDPSLLVLNYANPDMVGHTGDYEAAVAAVEAVDEQLGRLVEAARNAGADLFVLADHGNADEMGPADDPHTAHTTNPVPFVAVADDVAAIRDGGTLADVAPTVLEAMELEIPDTMDGTPLVEYRR
ncbi:2,3-bisphosphoglycerate-independent phosphoglycerate mutase [Halocatena halophila]|uniref:2,3-bisphosphoglycerate-independent phosphoglycerate mutase n=1 Tax=Halocatena halophila TaxID=2814576 RepID=UPI002ED31E78